MDHYRAARVAPEPVALEVKERRSGRGMIMREIGRPIPVPVPSHELGAPMWAPSHGASLWLIRLLIYQENNLECAACTDWNRSRSQPRVITCRGEHKIEPRRTSGGALVVPGLRVSRGHNQGSSAFLSVSAGVPWIGARAVRPQQRGTGLNERKRQVAFGSDRISRRPDAEEKQARERSQVPRGCRS